MAAHVKMSINIVPFTANDNDLFTRNIEQKIITFIGDAVNVVNILPLPSRRVSGIIVRLSGA